MWLFPPWFVSLIVTLLSYLRAHYGFSHRRVGVGYALQDPPVVTRSTVYRRFKLHARIHACTHGMHVCTDARMPCMHVRM